MAHKRCLSQLGYLLIYLLGALAIQFTGCSTSDTRNSNGGQTPLDLTGSWELTTTIASNTCGLENGPSEPETVFLGDSDDGLTVTVFAGLWGTATLSGNEIEFNGTETSNDFSCAATLSTDGSGTASATEIAGTFTTIVSFDQDSCPGTDDCEIELDFTMTKLEECPCIERAVFGDPDSSDYILPFPVGVSYPVYQSYCYPAGGHRCQLAYDFTIPIGDPVVAARGGVVRAVKEDSPDDGQGAGEHNFVYIEHDDGTCAFYAHLMQNGVLVAPGDTVDVGEEFAASGNSGYSGEPHLHFGVYEDYPTVEGEDIPINFGNADGPMDARGGLIRGETYTALPY